MIAFSFNDPAGRANLTWQGFSIDAWLNPLGRAGLADAVFESLVIATLSTLIATIIGVLMALALVRHSFRGRGVTNLLVFLPMSTPEIVLGTSLLTLFIASVQWTFVPKGTLYPLGMTTILIAHVMFNISFVVVTVRARLLGFPTPPGGGSPGPLRGRLDDLLEGDLPAHPAGRHRGRAAGVQPVHRRLRHHRVHIRADDHLPAVHLRRRSSGASRCRSTSSAPSSS